MTLNHALRLADFRYIFSCAGRYPTLTVRVWYGREKRSVFFDSDVTAIELATQNSKGHLKEKWTEFCRGNNVSENSICRIEAIRFSNGCLN